MAIEISKMFGQMPTTQSLYFSTGGFTVQWSAQHVGFGQFRFYKRDGHLYIDNEIMSKGFIKETLCRMVDEAVLYDEVDADKALRGETHFKDYVNKGEGK